MTREEEIAAAKKKLKRLHLGVTMALYEMPHAMDDVRYAYHRLAFGRVPLPQHATELRKAVKWLDEATRKFWEARRTYEGYWRYCCDIGIVKEVEEYKLDLEEVSKFDEFKDRAYWKTEG